ncbi:vomeronasal type-1 receptor 4-like [Equus caballus]|uniref:Vomeronasal type-1 receptor n=1 Tax=Equus caballus TaxID=9796 RepID=A0A3Q2HEM1_HORSE|nr:vomeronasal type-1 receptor 4-like [Equus caballus]
MALIIIKGIIFIFITGPGIMGNIFVFITYMCIFFQGTEKKSIHLILMHLAFANTILLFFKGIPKTIATFGLISFLNDGVCKTVVYLERVARGLTVCTTSFLTVVQAITIIPRAPEWAKLKSRSKWHIFCFFLFFWIFNSLLSMNLLYYIQSISSINSSQDSDNNRYCYFIPESQKVTRIFLILMGIRDALCQCLTGWASVYMVFLLHKHHKHVLYLQNSKVLYRTPPEIRAAQSVLLLMLCFLFFYWTDCIFSLYFNSSFDNNFIELNILEILNLGYASLSPFVLIHRHG